MGWLGRWMDGRGLGSSLCDSSLLLTCMSTPRRVALQYLSSSTTHTHSLQRAKVLDLLGDPRYQTIATFTDTASEREALNVQLSLFSGSTDEEKQQDMSKCDIAFSGRMSGIKLVFVSLFIKRLQVSR